MAVEAAAREDGGLFPSEIGTADLGGYGTGGDDTHRGQQYW
jgi:hypothetical protein